VKTQLTFSGMTEKLFAEAEKSIKIGLESATKVSKEKITLVYKSDSKRRRLQNGIVEAQFEVGSDSDAKELAEDIADIPEATMIGTVNDELAKAGFDQISLTDLSTPEAVTSDQSFDTDDTSSGDDNPNVIIFIAIGCGVVVILACAAFYMTMNSGTKVVQSGSAMMEMQAAGAKRHPESSSRDQYDQERNYGGSIPPDNELDATPGYTGLDIEPEGDAILTRYT